MTHEDPDIQQQGQRSELRNIASEFASIEFKPLTAPLGYHFKLRDFSSSGLGVFVKKESDLLTYIKIGDILSVKYHKGSVTSETQHFEAQVRHISLPGNGKPENHMIVGLSFITEIGGEGF